MEIVCFYLPFPFGGRVFYQHNCAPLNLTCWGFFVCMHPLPPSSTLAALSHLSRHGMNDAVAWLPSFLFYSSFLQAALLGQTVEEESV